MQRRGEYRTGAFSDLITIPKSEHEHWKRKAAAGEAKPEAQLVSEYSKRTSRDIPQQINYNKRQRAARKWWRGVRYDNEVIPRGN